MAVPKLAGSMRYLVAGAASAALLAPAGVALAEGKSKTDFDPEAYERAAKALREIKNSPLAKQVRGGGRKRGPRVRGCPRITAMQQNERTGRDKQLAQQAAARAWMRQARRLTAAGPHSPSPPRVTAPLPRAHTAPAPLSRSPSPRRRWS